MLRLTLLLSMLCGPAFALSCKAPNFGENFNEAAAAEEVYSLMYGHIQPADPVPEYQEGKPREFVAAFIGKQLGGSGFSETVTLPVTVKTECVSAWCGPVPPFDEQMLVFIEQVGADLVLTSQACPGTYHLKPSLGQISAVRACMSALQCGAEEISAFADN